MNFHPERRTFYSIRGTNIPAAQQLTILTAVAILGGIKSIARVCEGLVPFMAVFYFIGCAILLVMHWDTVPGTVMLILESAFTGPAGARVVDRDLLGHGGGVRDDGTRDREFR